jgi:hypothetical protein
METDGKFGGRLMLAFADAAHAIQSNFHERLSESALGNLYVWLYREFPPSEDPQFEGVHPVGSREELGRFRDGLLEHLKRRGTDEAVVAMRSVAARLPAVPWITWSLSETEAETRRQTWRPPEPETLLAFLSQTESVLVEGGEQLLDLIEASLRRLQQGLRGDTPMVRFLWEPRKDGIAPKSEPDLADFVKNHLSNDLTRHGVVVNREVEIRRGTGTGIGERTDVHVDALSRLEGPSYERVSAVIEVKCNWNPNLLSDLREQLAERYLLKSGIGHGIYLVGWFESPSWANSDPRRARTRGVNRLDSKERLTSEAAAATSDGLVSMRVVFLDMSWSP